MDESRNIYDLLGKIEWEGGIYEVLDYGLHVIDDYDVPDSLKEKWEEMDDAFCEFMGLMNDVQAELSDAETNYSNTKEY
jgi:hypothetical protein